MTDESGNDLGDGTEMPPADLGSLPPPPPPTAPTDSTSGESATGKRNLKWILAGAVAAVVIIGAIAAVALSGGGSKSQASSKTTSSITTSTIRTTTTTIATTTTSTLPVPVITKEMCTETPPDGMLAKDGNSFKGQCLHFWAHVFQFDAATGACSLMAMYSNSYHRYNFEYGNTILMITGGQGPGRIVQGPSGKVQLPPSSCVQLGPITQEDNIEVWGVVEGVESYSTKAGGTNQYLKIGLVDAYKR